VKLMSSLWNHIKLSLETYGGWLTTLWHEVKSLDWEEDNKKLVKDLREIKVDRKCHAFIGVNNLIKNWTIFLPLVS